MNMGVGLSLAVLLYFLLTPVDLKSESFTLTQSHVVLRPYPSFLGYKSTEKKYYLQTHTFL